MRLDKFLSEAGAASRREVRALLKAGAVCVNGVPAQSPEQAVSERDAVTLHDRPVEARRTVVLLLHKPAGYVTSTDDPRDRTVMELIPEKYRAWDVAPVGRLDKDTEGLLLLTNDGALAHRLISPRSEVEKCYFARHAGCCGAEEVAAFAAGLTLKDGTLCKPAKLEPLGEEESRVTVTEGKYHQVRRMLASLSHPVSYLRREREGPVSLGDLPVGALRELSEAEITALRGERTVMAL